MRQLVLAFGLLMPLLAGCEKPVATERRVEVAPAPRWVVAPGEVGAFDIGPLQIDAPDGHRGIERDHAAIVVQQPGGACRIRWEYWPEGVPAPIGGWVMGRAMRLEQVPGLQLESTETRVFAGLEGRIWQAWTLGPMSEAEGRRGAFVVGLQIPPGLAFAFTSYPETQFEQCRDRLVAHAATARRRSE